jgi:hypothetical protein
MAEHQSFADYFDSAMSDKGWSSKDLAAQARVSFRAISYIRSGEFEKSLKRTIPKRKKIGMSGSIYRILRALGPNPKEWMDKLGLEIPKNELTGGMKFENKLRLVLTEPLTAEDIEQFGRVQKEIGELFSVEMALRLIMRKHLEMPDQT